MQVERKKKTYTDVMVLINTIAWFSKNLYNCAENTYLAPPSKRSTFGAIMKKCHKYKMTENLSRPGETITLHQSAEANTCPDLVSPVCQRPGDDLED